MQFTQPPLLYPTDLQHSRLVNLIDLSHLIGSCLLNGNGINSNMNFANYHITTNLFISDDFSEACSMARELRRQNYSLRV